MFIRKKLCIPIVLFTPILLWLLFCADNHTLTVSHYSYANTRVPESFDGYRIVQLADLHNAEFGANQSRLVRYVEQLQPDLIVFTGDQLDCRHTDTKPFLDLARQLCALAPVYAVSGNHERQVTDFDRRCLQSEAEAIGVTYLSQQAVTLKKGNESILLGGTDDPVFFFAGETMEDRIRAIPRFDALSFRILLSHRPELADEYASAQVDLVLSGHAHGGQIRLPFTNGLYAPQQGIFPKLTSGMHIRGSTTLIISRGLGNSSFPLRIGNRPEIVCVTLHSA